MPIQIKSKYYPWAIMVFFSLFFGIQLDLFVGFVVGYMYIYGFLKSCEITPQRAKAWESKFPFKNYAQKPEFALADQATDNEGLPTFVRSTPPPPTQASTFSAFQGKGVKLGSEPTLAINTVSSNSSRTSVDTGSSSLAGKSALVSKDGKFKKPQVEINDEDVTTIDMNSPTVAKEDRKNKNGGGSDYLLVNH